MAANTVPSAMAAAAMARGAVSGNGDRASTASSTTNGIVK